MSEHHARKPEPHRFGRGSAFVVTIPGIQPAAGANYQLPQDGRYITRVLFAAVRLVTGAAVASRVLTLDYVDNNGNVYAQNGAAIVIAANATNDYRFDHHRAVAEWTTTGPVFAPLAEDYLQPGEQLQINVQNIAAADQLSNIFLRVERYETGPRGPLGAHHQHPRFAFHHLRG